MGLIALGATYWTTSTAGFIWASINGVIPAGERTWFLAGRALTVAALVLFNVTSRRSIAEGLAMHANPSPDRIAPYA